MKIILIDGFVINHIDIVFSFQNLVIVVKNILWDESTVLLTERLADYILLICEGVAYVAFVQVDSTKG